MFYSQLPNEICAEIWVTGCQSLTNILPDSTFSLIPRQAIPISDWQTVLLEVGSYGAPSIPRPAAERYTEVKIVVLLIITALHDKERMLCHAGHFNFYA